MRQGWFVEMNNLNRGLSLTGSRPLGSDSSAVRTLALSRFVSYVRDQGGKNILDFGPIVGGNVDFFDQELGCRMIVEDLYNDLEAFKGSEAIDSLGRHFVDRLRHKNSSIDGILCWDLFDYLDQSSADALVKQIARVLRPGGSVFGMFGMEKSNEPVFTKHVIVDIDHLDYRPYEASRCKQSPWSSRDVIKLFSELEIDETYLLKRRVREMLFRKPKLAQTDKKVFQIARRGHDYL